MTEISHSKYPQNFIDKLPHIHASFAKRFFATFLDMMFSIIINVPIFLVLCRYTGGVTDTFNLPNIYNISPKPITMLCFSVYMLVWCLFLFCIFPLIYSPQTLFSSLFGIKAITLSGEKTTPVNYFKAYFVPMFLVLFANIAFFSMACSSNQSIMYITFTKGNSFGKYWVLPIKLLFLAVILIQVHYLMTVALSKNKRNWFAKAFDIVYVDIKKAQMFLSDIQDPNEIRDKTLFQGDGADYSEDSEEDMGDEGSEEDLEDEGINDDSEEDMDDESKEGDDIEDSDDSEGDDMEDSEEDSEGSEEDSEYSGEVDSDEETEDLEESDSDEIDSDDETENEEISEENA